jgi:RNA polymerase sigma-70 factor (ECF subfamily)
MPEKEEARTQDARLLAMVRDGAAAREAAFTALYRRHGASIFRQLYVLLGPSEDIEGAVQTVFEQAFRGIDRFRGDSSLSTWLHGIAVNVALNLRRSRNRRKRALNRFGEERFQRNVSGTDDAVGAIALQQQLAALEAHLAKLSEKKRVAFVLYYVEELSLTEVAARMQASPDTTWTRIKRARAQVVRSIKKRESVTQRSGWSRE